jgi:predicted metal-binding membrane protein
MGKLCLGKKNKLADTRMLQFSDYVSMVETPLEHLVDEIESFFTRSSALPAAPGSLNDEEGITNWMMMDNDTVGDCTCAAAGHLIMAWTAMVKAPVIPTAAQILAAYEAISGYNPANPNSDVGAACLSVLNYWKKTGIAGNQIGAFMEINVENSGYIPLC